MNIAEIRDYILKQDFKITDHAFEEMRADELTFSDIIAALMNGEIIEDYPTAYPFRHVL